MPVGVTDRSGARAAVSSKADAAAAGAGLSLSSSPLLARTRTRLLGFGSAGAVPNSGMVAVVEKTMLTTARSGEGDRPKSPPVKIGLAGGGVKGCWSELKRPAAAGVGSWSPGVEGAFDDVGDGCDVAAEEDETKRRVEAPDEAEDDEAPRFCGGDCWRR